MMVTLFCSDSMYKKITAILVVLYLSVSGISVQAVSPSLTVREECKSGKAFQIYLSVISDTPIGAEHIRISYDNSILTFKSALPERQTDNDMLSVRDDDGIIDILYLAKNHRSADSDMILNFRPNDARAVRYDFEVSLVTVCDTQGDYLDISGSQAFSFQVVSEMPVSSSVISAAEDSPTVSRQTSKKPVEKPVPSELSVENVSEETTVQSSEEHSDIYRVIHEETKTTQNDLFLFAGIVIVIIVSLLAVYKKGFQHGKETDRKTEK